MKLLRYALLTCILGYSTCKGAAAVKIPKLDISEIGKKIEPLFSHRIQLLTLRSAYNTNEKAKQAMLEEIEAQIKSAEESPTVRRKGTRARIFHLLITTSMLGMKEMVQMLEHSIAILDESIRQESFTFERSLPAWIKVAFDAGARRTTYQEIIQLVIPFADLTVALKRKYPRGKTIQL